MKKILIGIFTLIALFLSACGDSDSDDGTPTSTSASEQQSTSDNSSSESEETAVSLDELSDAEKKSNDVNQEDSESSNT